MKRLGQEGRLVRVPRHTRAEQRAYRRACLLSLVRLSRRHRRIHTIGSLPRVDYTDTKADIRAEKAAPPNFELSCDKRPATIFRGTTDVPIARRGALRTALRASIAPACPITHDASPMGTIMRRQPHIQSGGRANVGPGACSPAEHASRLWQRKLCVALTSLGRHSHGTRNRRSER